MPQYNPFFPQPEGPETFPAVMLRRIKDAGVAVGPDDDIYQDFIQSLIVLHQFIGTASDDVLRTAEVMARATHAARMAKPAVAAAQAVVASFEAEAYDARQKCVARHEAAAKQQREEASIRTGSVVYYIRRSSLVKIGTTENLYKRMASLLPDEILAVEPGSYLLESQMHQRFHHLQDAGPGRREWFRLGEDLKEHIARVRATHGDPPDDLPIMPA